MIEPGTVLGGKYVVERMLGEGGMGVVVAAKHTQLGHRVAIKMMLGDSLRNADALARFEREARAAAELSSEHVARVTDVGHFDDGMPYMVMEYLEGEDLAARIRRAGPLPVGDVIRLFIQACIGLGDAHERGIVHRDIKPPNLFLSTRRGGRVTLKVLDFGIAKANLATSDHNLTRTSALMGSPQYMSPEQLRDTKNVDARTDMWSLGASVYEALTGVPAFPAETLAELHVKILMEHPTPTFSHRPEVPLDLDAIVMRCLAKQPGQRFSSMQQLQDALEIAERALAVPRELFRSHAGFGETAVPSAEGAAPFVATGKGRTPEGSYVQSTPNAAVPNLSIGQHPRLPRASADHLAATFGATDNPISQTMGGLDEAARPRKKAPIVAAAGLGALVVAGVFAMKIAGGGPRTTAATAPPPAADTRAAQAVEVAPALRPSAPPQPALAPPSVDEAPAGIAAVAPEPEPVRAPKKKGKATRAPRDVTPFPVAAPAEEPVRPRPKKSSAFDVELD